MLVESWNGQRWSILSAPTPPDATGAQLKTVSCSSRTMCVAAGSYFRSGSVALDLVERWNGKRWAIGRTPNLPGTISTLPAAVSCASPLSCTIVGYPIPVSDLTPLAPVSEHWNGKRWSIQRMPVPTGTSYPSMDGVSCASATTCIAVGNISRGGITVPLAERWSGQRWLIQHTPAPAKAQTSDFLAVSCSSERACTAVGGLTNPLGLTLAERYA